MNIFHDLEIVNRKTGRIFAFTQIASSVELAIANSKRYNFAEIDFVDDYEIREPIDPAEACIDFGFDYDPKGICVFDDGSGNSVLNDGTVVRAN